MNVPQTSKTDELSTRRRYVFIVRDLNTVLQRNPKVKDTTFLIPELLPSAAP